MFGVSTNTVLGLLEYVGEAASGYQFEHIRNVKADFIQMDEIWSFIGKKGNNVWCWVALEITTKLRITWHVGDRSSRSAMMFCSDLSSRLVRHGEGVQVSSDGLASYKWAVSTNMPDCHFAQLVKTYAMDAHGFDVCTGAIKMPVQGDPQPT